MAKGAMTPTHNFNNPNSGKSSVGSRRISGDSMGVTSSVSIGSEGNANGGFTQV